MTGKLPDDIVTAKSVAHLIELLENPTSADPLPVHANWFYRGFNDASFQMLCSLRVNMGAGCSPIEASILRDFRKFAPGVPEYRDDRNVPTSDWELLTVAQHHGVPTRMLDWTINPQVAMFFAVDWRGAGAGHDACVVVVDADAVSAALPPALQTLLGSGRTDPVLLSELEQAYARVADLEADADDPSLIFFDPRVMDPRILVQGGLHSILSHPDLPVEDALTRAPGSWLKVVIPADVCLELRIHLDRNAVTEFSLFPGLDGLGRWMKRKHRP